MALTRITGTVIEDNAITTDKISNAAITGAMIAPGAISADKLSANVGTSGPTSDEIIRVNANLTANVNSVKANVDATQANVAAITDSTTDLNIGSGKYVFDKSLTSLGINNTLPIAGTVSLGVPANIILKYSTLGGNVLINSIDDVSSFRFDVRCNANTGPLSAVSFCNTGIPDALSFASGSGGGLATFKDDVTVTGNLIVQNTSTFTDQVNMSDDLVVTGNLSVLGVTTTVNTENLVIQDNFMALANSQPFDSATSLDSGIFFNRGSAGNAALYYDQSATGFRLSETRDPFANAAISPTHGANLTLANLFAETITIDGTALTSTATELNKLDGVTVTTAEINRLDGVSSDIQTQLDAKIATTASASNDFVTFARLNANVNVVSANSGGVETRLNANLDVVQDNVAAITGGGTLLKPISNSNVQAVGSTANTFFIGAAMPGDGLANIISVALDGVTQQKDVPSGTFAANNDFIMNAVAAHASIKFTAPSIPEGSTVIITALKA